MMESDSELKKREMAVGGKAAEFKTTVESGVSALSAELDQTKKNVAAELLMQEEAAREMAEPASATQAILTE